MLKWVASIIFLFICAFVLFAVLHGVSLRRASLINGMNGLRVAYSDYQERGYVTNYSTTGYRVWLSTNVVMIGGAEYHCFAEVGDAWGYDGGTLAMTTNQIFIWLDTRRPPKIVTSGHQPPLFSGRH
jgi:hypothetical protein